MESMRTRFWRFFVLLSAFLFSPLGDGGAISVQEAGPQATLLSLSDELMPVIVRLRGLQPKSPIQKGVKTRDQISQLIAREIGDNDSKGELARESLLLQKLGFIPPEMDYVNFRLRLLTEQIGGFYDPEKRALFIAGWLTPEEQKPALVHELTHALQDQHFNLGRMMKRDRSLHNDDMSLAHQTVAEGDATAVMLDYILEPMGMSFLNLPDLMPLLRMQLAVKTGQMAVFGEAPEYFKESLTFPYIYGISFLQKIRARNNSWSAIDRIYADMPASSEQILHPDKYLVQRDPPKSVAVKDPTPRLGKGWKITYKNVMGEFLFLLLLKQYLPEEAARTAASGWGGDQIILVQQDKGKTSAVIMEAVWDDEATAHRLYVALSGWLQKRYPKSRLVAESESGLELIAGGEYHGVRRRGDSLRLILGLPEFLCGRIADR
jgi:hypothetical protein